MCWCKAHLLDPLSLTVMAWWWSGTELMQFVTRMLVGEQTVHRHLQGSYWYVLDSRELILYERADRSNYLLPLLYIRLEISVNRLIRDIKD